MALPRPILAASLLGCALIGGYAAVGAIDSNGLGEAIFAHVVNPPHEGYPGAPKPLLREFTGVKLVDDVLAILVGFFSALLDGNVAPSYRLFGFWAAAQFGACWTLVALEGLRAGNRGRLISWTGTMGLIFQTCSWTITTPLWLILHLFTSPIAKISSFTSTVSPSVLLVDLWDLAVLPLTVSLTYITPALPMLLPTQFGAFAHYAATALWQPFPLWHSIVQFTLSHIARFVDRTQGSPSAAASASPAAYLVQVKSVYSFVTLLSVVTQVTILQLVLAPAVVRKSLAVTYPSLAAYADPSVTFASVFVPHGPLSSPAVDPAALGSGDLAPLAVHFLQYDMYFGCGAMLLWALYLHRNAVAEAKASAAQVAAKVAWWFALGGFAGALSTLLWERDSVVEDEGAGKAEKKTQ